MKLFDTSLFIFRRDLRLDDNTALNAALSQSKQVIAAFIFDPQQIQPHPYQSQAGLQFMLQALADLQQQLAEHNGKLYLFHSKPIELISQLNAEHKLDAVFVNRDYTPFSRQRDADLYKHCQQLGLSFHSHNDLLLNEPEQLLKANGWPYQVFTPFYNRAKQNPVALPTGLADGQFFTAASQYHQPQLLDQFRADNNNPFQGGRQQVLAILNDLQHCQNYAEQRDFPALDATSNLSAHLKFGCCSVREAFYAVLHNLGSEHPLIRQFYWRDFFSHIAFHYPQVFGHAFHSRYDAINWSKDQDRFWAWANGKTGFPIVDAGMRQLNQTGCMHNRLRMITASFLVKDLHISWRWGERYFAQKLIDYDPCVNNGNWQWAASTGCDAQPYFRIFNPWLQQQKFDPDCLYIKRWLPELQSFSPKAIHNWQNSPLAGDYPPPMVDHSQQSQAIKAIFKALNPLGTD
jgi:deoxyribodipyrimidine photo-lyase